MKEELSFDKNRIIIRDKFLFRTSSGNPRQFNCRDESAIKKRAKEKNRQAYSECMFAFSYICAILCV